MPPVAAAIAAWAGVSVAAAYAIIATVVISAGMAVYGSAQARKAERRARDEMNAALKDRMATRIATEAPHRYIYGRAKVGADIVAMFTSGDRDQYRHLVCVHAAHECDAIEEVWVNNALVESMNADGDATSGRFAINPGTEVIEENHTGPQFTLQHSPRDKVVWVFGGAGSNMHRLPVKAVNGKTVTIDYTGPVVVNYERAVFRNISGSFSEPIQEKMPVVRVQKHLGGADDGVDLFLRTVMQDKWPLTAVLRGMCYTVITLDLNHSEFQGGLVPIHAVIRGRKLYDPRTGEKVWSQNPALAIMDYLTSPLCAVPMSDLPVAQFITAANVCDEAWNVEGGRYTINGTVNSDQSQSTVLEAMAQAMAGGLVATTWDVYAGKYVAPVMALSENDIVGGLSVTPGVSDASIYNGIKGQYIAPENNNVMTDFKPYQNAVYREADGRDLYSNIDFPFTDSLQRVTNLARVFTEDQRNGFTIKAEFSLKAWPLKVGQRVTFTSKLLGQAGKVYRITDKAYSPNSAVQLTLKEDAASIWDSADAVTVDSTPNSDLPDPWAVAPLASITCSSGEATLLRQADGSTVPRILVSWPAAPTSAVFHNGQIEVEWRAVSSMTWSRATVAGSETQAYLSPITPGFYYIIRARCVNPYLNTTSDWITELYQVVVFEARPRVYKWAASMPVAPTGASALNWATKDFTAPSGWSKSVTAAPAAGVTCFAAEVYVTDISADVPTAFDWAGAAVTAVGMESAMLLAAIEAAQNDADDAATAAANALGVANTANAALADIANDNLLTPGEKPAVVADRDAIVAEQAGIEAQATAFGITTEKTAYTAAITALTNYLGTLAGWNTIPGNNVTIVGTTFRQKFADVYAARQTLLNKVAAVAATKADWTALSGIPYESILNNDDSVAMGFNPTFADWSSGAIRPTGWSGSAVTKDTVNKRLGQWGVKFATTGAAQFGINRRVVVPALPLGTFIAGTFDVFISDINAANTTGKPGLMVRLWYDDNGTARYTDRPFAAQLVAGQWQRINFTARQAVGRQITQIEFYVFGSFAGQTAVFGGHFYGNVTFDSFRFALYDYSLDNTAITIAPDGTLGGAGGGKVTITGLGFNGDLDATKGAPTGTMVAGVSADAVATAATNFNASNDRNATAVVAPTILTDGTAVDHTIRTDGAADISFEWRWAGNEGDIDGFLIHVYQSSASTAYTFGTTPAAETVYTVPANRRAFILFGAAANLYTTFGVQAYRSVDKDVSATGVIRSSMVRPSLAAENPYRPSANVAFAGDVTGTVKGSIAAGIVNPAALLVSGNGDNLILDPRFKDLSWWGRAGMANVLVTDWSASNTMTSWKSNASMYLFPNGGVIRDSFTKVIPLVPGATYRIEYQLNLSSDFQGEFALWWYWENVSWENPSDSNLTAFSDGDGIAHFNTTSAKGFRTISKILTVSGDSRAAISFVRIKDRVLAGSAEIGGISITRVTDSSLIKDEAVGRNHLKLDKINITGLSNVNGGSGLPNTTAWRSYGSLTLGASSGTGPYTFKCFLNVTEGNLLMSQFDNTVQLSGRGNGVSNSGQSNSGTLTVVVTDSKGLTAQDSVSVFGSHGIIQ